MVVSIGHSRQPLWGGTRTASTALTDTFTIYGSDDWGDNWASSIIPAAGFVNNFAVRLNGHENTGSRTYTVWKGTVAGATAAISWSSTALAVTIANGAIVGSDTTTKVTVAAGDFLQIRVTGSGTVSSRHLHFGIVFNPTTDGQNILTGVTGLTQLSTATERFPMAGGNDVHTVGLHRMYFPTAGTVRDLYAHLATSPHTSITIPARSRTFTVRKNGTGTTLAVTLESTTKSGSNGNSFAVVDGDYIDLQCTTANSPASSYLSAGVVFEPTNKDEFINQYCPNNYMPENPDPNPVNHQACNMGGRNHLVIDAVGGNSNYYAGMATASWTMTYSRHHRAKTLLAAKGRNYQITDAGTHLNTITAASPDDITDSSPTSAGDAYESGGTLGYFRQAITANNVPISFKNTMASASLWHWLDTGSDEVDFF